MELHNCSRKKVALVGEGTDISLAGIGKSRSRSIMTVPDSVWSAPRYPTSSKGFNWRAGSKLGVFSPRGADHSMLLVNLVCSR